jgi:acyl-coenzyme A thioesterase PaaI-like protein
MSVDFEAVRAGLEQAIPFNKYLGLEVTAVSDGSGSVRLPEDPNLLNHVGSQHAGALFSVAEAASGAAFVGAFLERMGEITPLAKSASIDYRKIAKGPIVATGTLAEEKAALLERLDADGRVEFTIDVSLRDAEDLEVATTTVDWHVRRKDG